MAFNLPEACGCASPICPMRIRSLMGCAFSGNTARDAEAVATKWRRFMSVLLMLDGVIINGKLEKNLFLSSFLVLRWFKIGLYETGRSYSRSH